MLILPTTYLGPTDWYKTFVQAETPQIEVMESFPKQTLRNRCTILQPNGEPVILSVPVKKVESKQLTRDIEISYQQKWQHQHWMAIVSAYKHTPYFDYYQDYFRPFYERENKYLVDLNDELHNVIISLLNNCPPAAGPTKVIHTSDWHGPEIEHYWGDGISIIDSLFRLGPETSIKW